MRRHALGIIALVNLALWPILLLYGGSDQTTFVAGGCMRVGFVLGAAWLAYPQLSRLPAWFFGLLLACVLVVAFRPRLILAAVVVLIAAAILRPRKPAARRPRGS